MLGALTGAPARISELGKQMLSLPIHPRLARLLVAARECGRGREGATVAALLSERDIRARDSSAAPGRSPTATTAATCRSDVVDRLDMLALAETVRFSHSLRSRGIDPGAARQIALVRDDLIRRDRHHERNVARPGDVDDDDVEVLKWLLLAYPDRVVKRRGVERTGVMVGGRGVRLGTESRVCDAELYLALDAREDRRAGLREVSVSLASAIELEWLIDLFPAAIRRERLTYYDESRGRVVSAHRLSYHDLVLREDFSTAVDANEAGRVLAQALRPEAARLIRASPQAALWLTRLDFVARAVPELSWPEYSDDILADVLETACQGKTGKDEIEKADFVPYLASRLAPGQMRELQESAPLSLTIPSGKQVRLTYEPGRPPILAVRLQELFGWTETPRVARGRVAVLLHILGPNNRPVQITDDLRSFWTTTYHQVRKDLRGRYPKHAWPEDPFTAQPSIKGKPK
jgi:ATP-dependent helicase HrpB